MIDEFPVTRWSLISQIGHSESAIDVILAIYAPAISRYLAYKLPWLKERDHLDDVVQETLLILLKNPQLLARAHPGEGRRFRYLVMTTSYLLARNALRRIARHESREQPYADEIRANDFSEAMSSPFDSGDVLAEMDRSWAAGVIAEAWADLRAWCTDGTLDPIAGSLLHEHVVGKASVRDLAQQYMLPVTNCHRLLAKARTYLQNALVERLRHVHELDDSATPAQAFELLAGLIRQSKE